MIPRRGRRETRTGSRCRERGVARVHRRHGGSGAPLDMHLLVGGPSRRDQRQRASCAAPLGNARRRFDARGLRGIISPLIAPTGDRAWHRSLNLNTDRLLNPGPRFPRAQSDPQVRPFRRLRWRSHRELLSSGQGIGDGGPILCHILGRKDRADPRVGWSELRPSLPPRLNGPPSPYLDLFEREKPRGPGGLTGAARKEQTPSPRQALCQR